MRYKLVQDTLVFTWFICGTRLYTVLLLQSTLQYVLNALVCLPTTISMNGPCYTPCPVHLCIHYSCCASTRYPCENTILQVPTIHCSCFRLPIVTRNYCSFYRGFSPVAIIFVEISTLQGTRQYSGIYVGKYLCGVNIIGMWS